MKADLLAPLRKIDALAMCNAIEAAQGRLLPA